MTIPTKEEFDHLLENLVWTPSQELIARAGLSGTGTIPSDHVQKLQILDDVLADKETVISLCESGQLYRAEFANRYCSHSVYQFFHAQPSWEKAFRTLVGPRRESREFNIRERVSSFYDSADKRTQSRLRDLLIWRIVEDPVQTSRSVIRAFYNYYHTNKYAKVLADARRFEEYKKEAVTSLEKLSKLSVEFLRREDVRRPGSFRRISEGHFEYDIASLKRIDCAFPITRDDPNAKERLLAYELAKAIRSFKRPTVIENLLGIEGVKPVDDRTVARWLANWRSVNI